MYNPAKTAGSKFKWIRSREAQTTKQLPEEAARALASGRLFILKTPVPYRKAEVSA